MENNVELMNPTSVTNEILLVGALYKNPDLYVSYGNYMRSQYDFSDPVTKFLYDSFSVMYTTFTQTVDENKVAIFMSQDEDRLRDYKKYKGWKTISRWMDMADPEDFKNYYNIVKKYSLVREYERNGYPIKKLVEHKSFEKWTPQDIYRFIRSKADKINTVINAGEESVVLTEGTEEHVKSFLKRPDMGISMPWRILTKMFRGCRLGKVIFNGFLSNEGKSRNMMLLIAYIVLVKNEKFLLLSNEMDEDDLKNCLITTVINNPCFQELHGVKRKKPEEEIVLGIYRDNDGKVIERFQDDDGNFTETEDEFAARLEQISQDYRDVLKVSRWIDEKRAGKLFFKDVGSDYSDTALEFEFRKARMVYEIKYCGYDTLKGFRTDDWSSVKQTATFIKELMKELKMFCWSVFQLTDDSVFTDVFQLSSNNIANAKQMKHVADALMLGKRIDQEEYRKYQYISYDSDWGEQIAQDLDYNKRYFALKIDKNRGGNKNDIPLYEINLDYNTWVEVGKLIRKNKNG